MIRHQPQHSRWPALAFAAVTLLACENRITGPAEDLTQPVSSGSPVTTARSDSAVTWNGYEGLNRHIDLLRRAIADPALAQRIAVSSSWKRDATLQELLAHLEQVRRGPRVTEVTISSTPQVSGTSYIYVYGAAPDIREVEYFGETFCTGCNSDEFPEGDMSITQYTASGEKTLDASHRYMGMNNGYGSGSYYTTNYGNWQNGILQTRHFVDSTWGPWDPEYRSQANRSV